MGQIPARFHRGKALDEGLDFVEKETRTAECSQQLLFLFI